jgi:phenylalanyl-tRNA synthetase beta chain
VNASLRWLAELLGTSLHPVETRDRLLMLGVGVEGMASLHHDLAGIVIGEVLEVSKHPNADRLSLCLVNAGAAEPLRVVCGATNVAAGKRYPFAPVGAVLPGGIRLERRKIRGEVSEGMLCSARELGLGEDGEGIMELNTAATPGTPLLDALPLADTLYELEITPNRGDLLSHEGLARDLGASLGRPVKLPAIPGAPAAPWVTRAGAAGSVAGVKVSIEDAEGCPRYGAAVIRGLRVGPSPAWLRDRLAALGQRSINNVVDATNYLMLENGQPLHAFDLAKLRGPAIVVRRAREGERLITLDGVERSLSPEMTVIADAERATALAGVMGGAESEVGERTTDVLLECAYFDPKRTRRTRKELGLSTEASQRFERGVDHEATARRLARACELIVAAGGGGIEGAVDVFPAAIPPVTIFLRDERVAAILGVEIPRAELERVLTAIGCVVGPREGRLAVQVPAFRPDLVAEIDLIEEVARLVGYDRFPDELRPFRLGTVPDAPIERKADRVRHLFTSLGLHEAVTSPLGPGGGEGQVELMNPLSREDGFLRDRLLPGLVRRAEHNWRQMVREVRLFEIGHVFLRACDGSALPREEVRLAAVVSGARRPPHWSEPVPPDYDLFDVRGLVEALLPLAAPGAIVEAGADGYLIRRGETVVGTAAALEADRPAWAAALYGFEVALVEAEASPARYLPLPAWPAVQRDVALVLPEGVRAAQIEATLREGAGDLLERLWVFDQYRGAPLPEGTRSVAWRLVFRAADRTLREEEAERALAAALELVEKRHGVRRRTA